MDRNEPGTLLIDWQGANGFEEFMARIEIPYIRAFDTADELAGTDGCRNLPGRAIADKCPSSPARLAGRLVIEATVTT
jgi:hypothetical protein